MHVEMVSSPDALLHLFIRSQEAKVSSLEWHSEHHVAQTTLVSYIYLLLLLT